MGIDSSQNELLITILDKYKLLLKLLEAEGSSEVHYAISRLQNDIQGIEEVLEDCDAQTDYDHILHLLKSNYYRMYPPRGGLTDFVIPRKEVTDRIAANKPLIDIQEDLKNIYRTIT